MSWRLMRLRRPEEGVEPDGGGDGEGGVVPRMIALDCGES